MCHGSALKSSGLAGSILKVEVNITQISDRAIVPLVFITERSKTGFLGGRLYVGSVLKSSGIVYAALSSEVNITQICNITIIQLALTQTAGRSELLK